MDWKRLAIVGLLLVTAGWMLFDGARALIVGDYVTPQTGEYAGQLGPWADLVETVGIQPRSSLMKIIFVLYGLTGLVTAIAYAAQVTWSRKAALAFAILGLWYLPVGTVSNAIVLFFLARVKE